jgi:NAD+ kinase
MKIAIYGRRFDPQYAHEVSRLFDSLVRRGISVTLDRKFSQFLADKLSLPTNVQYFESHEDLGDVNFLLSIGGDGTLLDTASIVRGSKIPVLGINTGRLGFLSNASLDGFEAAIEALINGDFTIDTRSLIEVQSEGQTFDEFPYALNEVTILNKDRSNMLTVHAYINDQFMCTYWSDGLIVATPTGSTAYSLSCGGPIIMPGGNNLVLTPIAPHNLTVRPFVISNTSKVMLKAEGRDSEIILALDRRSYNMPIDTELVLQRASFQLHLVQLEGQNFFSTICNKMGWGLDRRN